MKGRTIDESEKHAYHVLMIPKGVKDGKSFMQKFRPDDWKRYTQTVQPFDFVVVHDPTIEGEAVIDDVSGLYEEYQALSGKKTRVGEDKIAGKLAELKAAIAEYKESTGEEPTQPFDEKILKALLND